MTDIDTQLRYLAEKAEEVADTLHRAINDVNYLGDRLLAVIEEIGGDREYNYDLYSDIKHSVNAVYLVSIKARTILRHTQQAIADRAAASEVVSQ